VAVTFSKDVSVAPAALRLVNDTIGQDVDLPGGMGFTYDAATCTARWDLTGLQADHADYLLFLDAAQITDSTARMLDGDGDGAAGGDFDTRLICTFAGDADLDGDVDYDDYAAARDHVGLADPTWAHGDSDGDGTIGAADYLAIKANFGSALEPVLPTVAATSLNDGSPMPTLADSLAVTFSRTVTVCPDALSLHNDSTDQNVPLPEDLVAFTYDPDSRTARWDISALNLPEAHYTATLSAAGVTAARTRTLDGNGDGVDGDDYAFSFLRTFVGDANRDGVVGAADYLALKRNFGLLAGATWADADFDNSGAVDYADYVAARDAFGSRITTVLPVVEDVTVNDGAGPSAAASAVSFRFNRSVDVAPAALSLHNDTAGQAAPGPQEGAFSYDPSTRTARWDLSALGLPIGRYTATLHAADVTGPPGAYLDGDADGTGGDNYQASFLVTWPGDADADGDVDFTDYAAARDGFGLPAGATPADGDTDGDGDTDHWDYLALKRNFGQSLTAGGLTVLADHTPAPLPPTATRRARPTQDARRSRSADSPTVDDDPADIPACGQTLDPLPEATSILLLAEPTDLAPTL